MDWNLRSCGRHGHATYAPDEPELCEHLRTETPVGTAWRCLRCGDYVVGEPKGRGPARDAPQVRRGRALRDVVILRLLAVERLVRGAVVLLIAYGVWSFRSHPGSLEQEFDTDVPLIQNLADKFHWDFANSSIVGTIRKFLALDSGTLTWIAAGLLVYGLLQLIEATGLWLIKRWGEYFAAVATSLFIPIEVYELVEKVTWVRIGALIINVGAVIYLLLTKRLFGLRGGSEAYEAERHEANLMEVRVAGVATDVHRPSAEARAELAAGEPLPHTGSAGDAAAPETAPEPTAAPETVPASEAAPESMVPAAPAS